MGDARPSLLRELFDTRLRYAITPMLVPWVYRGCMWMIAVGTAFWFLLAWSVAAWMNSVWALAGMLVVPTIGFVLLLFARVGCEVVLRLFSGR